MATPQDIIKAVATSLHVNHFKTRGFTKSGNTWIRKDRWPQVINIQLSSWNTAEEATLTINLGLWIGDFHIAEEALPAKGGLKEYDCDLRSRIGQLMPDKRDQWWKVTPNSDAEQLVEEIFAAMTDYGFPWFAKLQDLSAVSLEFSSRKNTCYAALAASLAGDAITAKHEMALALAAANSHFLPKLRRIAAAHSIPLPDD